jgi:MoxR-like ATPase
MNASPSIYPVNGEHADSSRKEETEVDQELKDQIGAIGRLSSLIKAKFVGKDSLLDMIAVCAIAHEHLLIVGPPGTAKSELVKQFALRCSAGAGKNGTIPYFEYLLTRFTEPNEIFGPVDVQKFQAGQGHHRITTGHLPKAEIAFLDEVFKSNSAILNSLLNILNERVFYNGDRVEPVPLLCAIGATNEIPDDTTLAALYDRFLVRMWTDNVDDSRFGDLLGKGWDLEKDRIQQGYQIKVKASVSTDALANVHRALEHVNLDPVLNRYHEVIRRIRSEGIEISDRRAIKLLKLIGSSGLLRQSLEANTGDFWVLAHTWNNPEQIPHLQAIIEPYLEGYDHHGWTAERDLKELDGEINVLHGAQVRLRTDADYKDFLQQSERLRQELFRHSDQDNARKLRDRLEGLIESAMKKLDDLD